MGRRSLSEGCRASYLRRWSSKNTVPVARAQSVTTQGFGTEDKHEPNGT
jgi:hypothetical protein